ncbi:MAG: hypothetical protein OHK0024_24360 [Thalassobaculales bacterium]
MATLNIPPAIPGGFCWPILIAGARTATAAGVVGIKVPQGFRVLGVSAYARSATGTSPTLTVDIKAAGSSILTTPVAVTAAAAAEASLVAGVSVADEALITIDLAIGGTDTPTWNDITVTITGIRLG